MASQSSFKVPLLVLVLLAANLAAGAWWGFGRSGGGGGSGSSGEATLLASVGTAATAADDSVSSGEAPPTPEQCRAFVSEYAQRRGGAISKEQDVRKMLFFLHVPRTAGKT